MSQALEGIKVLDFSHLLQGPFATQMLGDLGADVIKVERTGTGDGYRNWTFLNYRVGGEETPCFLAYNRNKRSLTLNLKSPEAKEIIYRLVKECDVVVENFRPGVMAKLGFGYEQLKEINPRIIYCSSTGYGQDGPYSTRPGQDLLIQSLTGLTKVTGRGDAAPTPLGTGIADQMGAFNIVYGILSSLYYREKTGKGQKIEVNLFQALLTHQLQELVVTLNLGRNFERPNSGIGHPGMPAPFGIYQTADGYICISANPIPVLAEVIGDQGLVEYDDPMILFDKRDEIFYRIQASVIKQGSAYWIEKMLERDLWVSEVKSHIELPEDPQVKHLNAFTSYHHPTAGEVKTVNIPVKFSETPGRIDKPAPLLGEHSEEILLELGYDQETIEKMKENKII
ncbi:CaiB/BaiF CoA transferase family protein [Ammoniphilus resinae]|uniref:Crotonobetainyl-CoA:carnitine CoA-transferase CaiB-like acyl-CoA transferase n=1 Tax=Ammoniphilus resinae TaxID=861532 RepID=A0ABS4GW35_9BACL|nr:CaiB/BaiF CoA-transferase family protein [Ammoniphilus resinae]MBP1934472.1 crotonobetainyl-CoA:carnitine CoA-transferase CaiB-like acyl-CoA transferase [Ammoniphilus resinae]